MCDPQTFDSRDSRYKRPYGAVPSGTRVELALRPPRAGGFSAATLIAYFEHRDEERRELPMPWRGLEGDRDVFDIALETGDYVGLVWYSFRLEGLDGRREELGPFQLTVYDGAEKVPTWFGEGVTYQIFPDRFRRTRVPDPTGMVGGRSVHTGWEEEPVSLTYDTDRVIRELHKSGLYRHAPYWCVVTENILRGGELSHGTVLARVMELCTQDTGSCSWPDIPEKYWEKVIAELKLGNEGKRRQKDGRSKGGKDFYVPG